jgi:hypothetical protein
VSDLTTYAQALCKSRLSNYKTSQLNWPCFGSV